MHDKYKLAVKKDGDLELSLDVGHSSIGWAVLLGQRKVQVEGCGVVIFRANDCLASSRRTYRRQRRHIRSTRQRIERIKLVLEHVGALKREELDLPGGAAPWQLAARCLSGGAKLNWQELWDVLRWYAHNRGYDGNRRWSGVSAESAEEDSEKEENAKHLMEKHKTRSMAETFCRELGLEPDGKKKASLRRFKGLNVAFPRLTVEGEVRSILRGHRGVLKGVDDKLERVLLGAGSEDRDAWKAFTVPGLKVPKRYAGGLLFGQLVPRFDNRIISKCPVTGQKVPSRNCREFYEFRWGMLLANVLVARPEEKELRPLTSNERQALHGEMTQKGALTASEFTEAVKRVSGAVRHNLDTMFMHPDAKESLVLDPVQHLTISAPVAWIWEMLGQHLQQRIRGKLRRGKSFSLPELREDFVKRGGDGTRFDQAVKERQESSEKGRKGKGAARTTDVWQRWFSIRRLQQRAAYSRPVLEAAFQEALAGKHPKAPGGCLCITEAMRAAEAEKELAERTNNHLVRHRLLILERLVRDLVKEFAEGNPDRVGKVTIEVNRDLREMSGKTAKEKQQELGRRIAQHHRVATTLEEALREERVNGKPVRITAGLIRKARIADDLDWTCPYTGQRFEPKDLATKRVDKDHIVPRADRESDALEGLVLTFAPVNLWKSRRTALQFVTEEQGKCVPGQPNLSVMTLSRYKEWVESLDARLGHDDDQRRKKRRKELLLLPRYEEKEFVPRDLTITSQLVRLGAQALQRGFSGAGKKPQVVSLPGAVTGAVRRAWGLAGCLSLANEEVIGEDGQPKTKTEIRDVTHLHHALDACVLGLASRFIPNNGRIWELMVKRTLTKAEQAELGRLGVFEFGASGNFGLKDLERIDPDLKAQIRGRLGERRVVQHIPARMDGLKVEENTWRVLEVKDGGALLEQRVRGADGKLIRKEARENVVKLLGLEPDRGRGKLRVLKGALVIAENFGVALDPKPTVIPFHKVYQRLSELRVANGGKRPRVIRNGQLIIVKGGKNYRGVWRVFSAKNNKNGICLDMGRPDVVRLQNKTEGHKINVSLSTLLKDGLEILRPSLSGIAACPTTS